MVRPSAPGGSLLFALLATPAFAAASDARWDETKNAITGTCPGSSIFIPRIDVATAIDVGSGHTEYRYTISRSEPNAVPQAMTFVLRELGSTTTINGYATDDGFCFISDGTLECATQPVVTFSVLLDSQASPGAMVFEARNTHRREDWDPVRAIASTTLGLEADAAERVVADAQEACNEDSMEGITGVTSGPTGRGGPELLVQNEGKKFVRVVPRSDPGTRIVRATDSAGEALSISTGPDFEATGAVNILVSMLPCNVLGFLVDGNYAGGVPMRAGAQFPARQCPDTRQTFSIKPPKAPP